MRNEMTPMEHELETALGGLKPAPTGLNRDRLMFAAGRASRSRLHFWQGLSAILVVLLVASVASRSRPRAPQPVRETVARAPAREAPAVPPYSQAAHVDRQASEAFRQYVNIRQAVLDQGIEALPAPVPTDRTRTEPPLTRGDLEDLLSST